MADPWARWHFLLPFRCKSIVRSLLYLIDTFFNYQLSITVQSVTGADLTRWKVLYSETYKAEGNHQGREAVGSGWRLKVV